MNLTEKDFENASSLDLDNTAVGFALECYSFLKGFYERKGNGLLVCFSKVKGGEKNSYVVCFTAFKTDRARDFVCHKISIKLRRRPNALYDHIVYGNGDTEFDITLPTGTNDFSPAKSFMCVVDKGEKERAIII
jgi:hypothetical protein